MECEAGNAERADTLRWVASGPGADFGRHFGPVMDAKQLQKKAPRGQHVQKNMRVTVKMEESGVPKRGSLGSSGGPQTKSHNEPKLRTT